MYDLTLIAATDAMLPAEPFLGQHLIGGVWKWFLDPGIGVEKTMQLWGLNRFSFTWIKDSDFAINMEKALAFDPATEARIPA